MRFFCIVVCLLSLAPGVLAQEAPSRLTLEDAIRLAREHNPEFRQVLNDVDVAVASERAAWGALFPSVSASLSFGGSHSRALTGSGDFGEVIVNPTYVETTSSTASQGVGLSMTLFDGGATLGRLRQERAMSRQVDARVAARAVQLRAGVARAFYAALRDQAMVAVEERLLRSAEEQLEVTRRRFEIGSARRDEVLGSEAQVAMQQQSLEEVRGAAEKSRLALLRQIGLEGAPAYEPVGQLPEAFDPSPLDVDALVEAALTASPRILERQAALEAGERAASAARGIRWPRITASLNANRGIGARDYEALFDFNPPNRSLNFNISASVPLFTGFRNTADIVRADASLEDAREQLRAERLALETEVRSAFIDLQNAYRTLELAERSLALSQERLELTEERYRAGGTVGFIELQNAVDAAARAERQLIAARFGFVVAVVALEEIVGREVRP